jgi:3-methyladenine DNA glycosylase AlkD
VKIEELKKFQKKIKKDHDLSLALFKTGNGDAMYLAGLIADEGRITKKVLQGWVKKATWGSSAETKRNVAT